KRPGGPRRGCRGCGRLRRARASLLNPRGSSKHPPARRFRLASAAATTMRGMRGLVVEDEVRLAEGLRRGLDAEGFAVDVATTGTDGLWLARENDYGVILLDIMLPGMSGYRVCETLRQEGRWTPILMLTAKDGEWDQVE